MCFLCCVSLFCLCSSPLSLFMTVIVSLHSTRHHILLLFIILFSFLVYFSCSLSLFCLCISPHLTFLCPYSWLLLFLFILLLLSHSIPVCRTSLLSRVFPCLHSTSVVAYCPILTSTIFIHVLYCLCLFSFSSYMFSLSLSHWFCDSLVAVLAVSVDSSLILYLFVYFAPFIHCLCC